VIWGAATGSATGLGLARGVAMVRAARARVRMVVDEVIWLCRIWWLFDGIEEIDWRGLEGKREWIK
jgi:hypothetical protein